MTAPSSTPTEEQRRGFIAELVDAITGRTFFLVLGVLVIQLAFVVSYVGAFHRPTPHRIPILVVAPPKLAATTTPFLTTLPGTPLRAVTSSSSKLALQRLRDGSTSGVIVINGAGNTDTLYVAGGGGAAVATALEQVLGHVERLQHRHLRVVDAVPAQPGDARGLSGFYLVIGWLIGGYLAAALLSLAHGARPANLRRASIRLIAMALYALVSGIGGALIVGPLLGALTGHVGTLWWLGALLVFSAAAVTMAFQSLAGVLGVGLTVILFVVLGNPSAGGAYPASVLPGFWRVISGWIPNGAGVQAVRRVVYFGGHGISGNVILIAGYALAGLVLTLSITAFKNRSRADSGPEAGSVEREAAEPEPAPSEPQEREAAEPQPAPSEPQEREAAEPEPAPSEPEVAPTDS